MSEKIKVSVIIPCYNQGQYIEEAVESVIKQTYNNIQIVIVNDGSTDNSSEIIKNLADKYKNILFFDEKENKGVIEARNLAIEASSGEYILPLDADDTIEPTYIEKAVTILNEQPDVGVVYCKGRMFGKKNKIWEEAIFDREGILYENCVFSCAMFRKKDFYTVGKYNENMEHGIEDWDLWLSFLEKNFKFYQINEVLFNYRRTDSITRSDVCLANIDAMEKNLFMNHINSYLNNKETLKRIFSGSNKNMKKLENRKKKYKKLFNVLLIVVVIETVLLSILMRFLCFQ